MKSLTAYLGDYAAYHRDPRTIATHFIGVPFIVLAIAVLLSRPSWHGMSPALLAMVAASAFYIRLDKPLGFLMAAILGLGLWFGHAVAVLSTTPWLIIGITLFVMGWAIQFLGHHYEGRKPAFIDDISGLLIGPLFVVVEFGFLLGLGDKLKEQIEPADEQRSKRPWA
jgi:uncharacterized membrane protein YGL010W